jgi:hypothetical protein
VERPDDNGIYLFLKIEIPHIPKNESAFISFLGDAIILCYIPNLYNLAIFFKSFGQITCSASYFQYGFAIIFLDKGIESILFVVINKG